MRAETGKNGSLEPINNYDRLISSRTKNALQNREHPIVIQSSAWRGPQRTRSGNFLFFVTVDGLGDTDYLYGLSVDHVLEHQIENAGVAMTEERPTVGAEVDARTD